MITTRKSGAAARRWLVIVATGALVVGAGGRTVQAAVTPYFETFDDDTTGDPSPSEPAPESGVFIPSLETNDATYVTSDWYVTGLGLLNNQRYRNDLLVDQPGGGGGSGSVQATAESTIQFPGLPGNNFQINYDFFIDALVLNSSPIDDAVAQTGMELFDPAGPTTPGYRIYYVLDENTGHGKLELNGPGLGGGFSSIGTIDPTTGVWYHMQIVGTYATPGDPTSDLTLDATLTLDDQSISVGGTSTNVLTNGDLSLRNRLHDSSGGQDGSQLRVEFDNFQVVPEPTGAAILAFAGTGLLFRRRRT